MNQHEVNRQVATKTGETISTIAVLGFVPLTGQPFEREPQTVDWDGLDAERYVSLSPRRTQTPVVALSP